MPTDVLVTARDLEALSAMVYVSIFLSLVAWAFIGFYVYERWFKK